MLGHVAASGVIQPSRTVRARAAVKRWGRAVVRKNRSKPSSCSRPYTVSSSCSSDRLGNQEIIMRLMMMVMMMMMMMMMIVVMMMMIRSSSSS
jgi:ABC-type Na+ efflux pump permease subunit